MNHVWQPAEWDGHSAVWTAWPSHPAYWEGHVAAARRDVAAFIRALSSANPDGHVGEAVHVWVDGADNLQQARDCLSGSNCHLHSQPFGDIWFRDIAPIFVRTELGDLAYRRFDYNGWGNKYFMPDDKTVAQRLADLTGLQGLAVPFVFEGGALDVDGTGLGLTTRSCLLNPNRNPSASLEQIESILHQHLGVEQLIWLNDGLLNDHTDGHIDNIARFVAPGKVVCQHAAGPDDPNAAVLAAIETTLRTWRGKNGQQLDVVTLPSPGKVCHPDSGEILPASHMNFYIANHKVLVPVYGTATASAAVTTLQALFPTREVVGLPANGLLLGGGSFHCITQQQPVSANA